MEEECPIDVDNAHYDELLYFALYGKPGVLKDNDPVLLTFMNQRLPPEKRIPVPEVETDDPVVLDLLGKKQLSEPPLILEKLPEALKEFKKDEDLPVYRRSYIVNFDWSLVKGEHRSLDYDKYLEVDESQPTPRMCRLLTMVCYKLLVYLEQHLLTLLKKCSVDMLLVKAKIEELKSSGPRTANKLSWLNIYGMPYFKDKQYFPCPANEDVLRKKRNKELLLTQLNPANEWTFADHGKLEQAIRSQAIVKRTEKVKREIAALVKAIDATKDEDNKAELKQRLSTLPSLDSIKHLPLEELCEDADREYDWLRIAAQTFEGYKDAAECKTVWQKCLHPSINRSTWTDEEDQRLKELVKDYNFQDWDSIAYKLGTNRSPLNVMQHYQKHLNDSFVSKNWTEEEEEALVKLVETYRMGSRILWKKVAEHMVGHTKHQIFKHWTYHVNPALRNSRFTKREDMLLVASVRSFGEEYSRLQEVLPSRSYEQLRARYKALTKPQPDTWGDDENEKLLSLVERYGEGRWRQIAECFTDRNWAAVKEQYTLLKERIELGTLSQDQGVVCEESRLWRRVQELIPNLKQSEKMDRCSLKELREILGSDTSVSKNSRQMNAFDKQVYKYFRCISDPNTVNEIDLFERRIKLDNPKVLKCLLNLLYARLEVPRGGFMATNHHLLQRRDKLILQSMAKETFMVNEDHQPPQDDKRVLKYAMPPNFTTLNGFSALLLDRQYLLDLTTQEDHKVIINEANSLLVQRLRSLFLWPALASAEVPRIEDCPPIEDTVNLSVENPRLSSKKKPTREEEFEFIGPPKKPKYTRIKLKKCKEEAPATSSSAANFTVVEIKDEGIYNTLLAAEEHKQQQTLSLSEDVGSFNTVQCTRTYSRPRKHEVQPTVVVKTEH